MCFVCWIGFQIWWDRKDKIHLSSSEDDEFVATPAFSHFIQTLGEWVGTFVGVMGFIFGLLSLVHGSMLGYELSSEFSMSFAYMGMGSIIISPVYGYIIIIGTRFIAEQVRVLVAIANNTKKESRSRILKREYEK